MSGPSSEPALTFTESGSFAPAKVIYADGSVAHARPGAPISERPTIVQRQLANSTYWDPPLILPGKIISRVIDLAGAEHGDLTMVAHQAARVGVHRVQMSAVSGDGLVEVIVANVGEEPVDIPGGQLRVGVTKIAWPA